MNFLSWFDYSLIGATTLEWLAIFIVCSLIREYIDKLDLPPWLEWLNRFDWNRLSAVRWFALYCFATDVLLAPVVATGDRILFWNLHTPIELAKTCWMCWLAGNSWNWNGHRETKFFARLPFAAAVFSLPAVWNVLTVTAEDLAHYHAILQVFAFVMFAVGIFSVVSPKYRKMAWGLASAALLAALANLARIYLGFHPRLLEISSLAGSTAVLFGVYLLRGHNGNHQAAAAGR